MSSIKNKNVDKETDEIDLRRLMGEVIDHRKLIVSVISLFTLIALIYALFPTPIYQADSLLQVEQKQGNAILSGLSQILPDSQPLSAPEITLLQSRMILGKTVDDLNLQARVEQEYFPIFGRGWSRLMGKKQSSLDITRLYIPAEAANTQQLTIKVKDSTHYEIVFNGRKTDGRTGVLVNLSLIHI